jgi:UDP-2,3-diacylglucosamine pyrophosphatase LpxH
MEELLVIHGDQFDIVVCNARWLAYLGDWAYDTAIFINTWYNQRAPPARRWLSASFQHWAKSEG